MIHHLVRNKYTAGDSAVSVHRNLAFSAYSHNEIIAKCIFVMSVIDTNTNTYSHNVTI